MNRRAVLRRAVTLAPMGLAGCLGGGDDDPVASTATGTDPSSSVAEDVPTATGSGALSASFGRLQPGAVVLGIDSVAVESDGVQFLFLAVESTTGDPPARSRLEFRFDGETHSPGRESGNGQLWRAASGDDDRYTAADGRGWVAFELPEAGDASDAALRRDGVEWRPPESVRARLGARPPSLSFEWSVPDTTTPGETPMRFVVTNEADRPGRFVAGVNEAGIRTAVSPIDAFSRPVPAGETVSWAVTHDNGVAPGSSRVGDGEPDGTYVLHWPGGRRERELSFVSAT